jgi:hypothetical protein
MLLLAIALTGCAIMACDGKSSQSESVTFTDDEHYLIEAYVEIRRARSHYPHQPAVGDSVLAELSATVDTVRVARTIAALNLEPDRWAAVYQEIEDRLRQAARDKELERSGG